MNPIAVVPVGAGRHRNGGWEGRRYVDEARRGRAAAEAARGPSTGQFVSLRGRLWLVEGQPETPFDGHRLACVDDDASGEDAHVLWSAEVDARLRDEEAWTSLASGGGDAETFSAYLRTVRWRTATAAERDLFQAPFRAGIRLDPYQLLPLRKALRLPRVNLLIADDVGLGKTVETGLVLREMLLRRRVDYMVVLAPAAMTGQWRDELQSKFGLSFEIVDRQHLEALRRRRGYGANPWATGSRFILSHRLLGDEAYVAGLRDVLEDFRARSLLILDEAHHAAPAGGGRYAVESQFTRSLRDLSDRFEHRLFLSATPHNGHPNSFATLLELLDPQRFTRGVPVRPADLEPVMVRRLKSDLRALGEAFPTRVVEPVVIDGLTPDAPELRLAAMLSDYRALRERRIGGLGAAQGARARLAFVGLQQRLLSSVPAFARTLRVHLAGLDRLIAGEAAQPVIERDDGEAPERADEEEDALARLERADATRAEAAAMAGGGATEQLTAERDLAAAMLAVAESAKTAPDARIRWIIDWARANLLDAEGRWRDRRLILFTEYEDTRRWLQRQLSVLLNPADAHEDARIDSFTGVTSTERREAIKRAFNDPASPLRILLCTDAAREGINLQAQCHDLIHVDLPWNPSRLEQRNGRIDRKLQPSDTVTCRYFIYAQRPEDIVLDALVRKTEAIRQQLGSAGEVLGGRIAERLSGGGI
ncbi:DISARM system SNF2-like helicase DrmD, partial [Sphingomonas sp.]|uniref:DISARM system SNF2-like helicase DrmD n=1 Tax=Sphingomonas sp. TaxID=28214 RepID=UPI0035AEAA51